MDSKNLKEIKVPESKHYFLSVWGLQKALLKEYTKIEELPKYPLNLDIKENQNLLKDFISRVVEELAEAYEQAIIKKDFALFYEELADALHFIVEVMIFSAPLMDFVGPHMVDILAVNAKSPKGYVKSKDINNVHLALWMWDVTYYLNLARNTLRNKPWKQTEVRTRKNQFISLISKSFAVLIYGMVNVVGLSAREIFVEYYKKNQINQFRIKSKY